MGRLTPLEFNTNVRGFDPATVYLTYDEYVNDAERKYAEYFLRDAYEFYGYDLQWYDGQDVTLEQVKGWTEHFSTIDHYIEETWKRVYDKASITVDGAPLKTEASTDVQKKLLDNQVNSFRTNRKRNAEILMKGLCFVNRCGQPLHMIPKLELDPALLEQPLYH